MKKYLWTISAIILLEFTFTDSHAQWHYKYYENRDLSELNSQELSSLLHKSNNVRKTGIIMTVSGIPIFITGCILGVAWSFSGMSSSEEIISTSMTLTGMVAIIGGIPIWIIGQHRKKEIGKMLDTGESDINLQIKPILQYNSFQNSYSPTISIVIQF